MRATHKLVDMPVDKQNFSDIGHVFRRRFESDDPTNKKATPKGGLFDLFGGPCWIRTSDQLVKSQLLYQLS